MKRALMAAGLVWVIAAGAGVEGAQGAAYQAGQAAPAKNKPASPPTRLSPQQIMDSLFLSHAAMAAIANDQLGQLAAKKAETPAVRRFGLEVVDASRTATIELSEIAKALGVFLPEKLPADAQAEIGRLGPLTGKPFDRAVMSEMWSQTRRDQSLYQRIAQQATDGKVKAWAAKALTQADEHQKLVKDLTLRVVGAPASSGSPGR